MLYAPHPKQQAVHDSGARYKVLNWGRRTGKSTLAVNYLIWEALKKYAQYVKEGREIKGPFNYFIVAPTYRQAKTIFWNDIIKTQIPREIVAKTNEAELELTIPHHNTDYGAPKIHPNAQDLPAIVVSLKGAENEDSLRGVKLSGVIMDEFAFIKPYVWDKIVRAALADERGWAVFISTPNGFNHFYEQSEFAKKQKGWFYSHATIYDNPHISRDEIEEIKTSEFSKDREGNTWYQEYMADFRQMAGLVYKGFDRKKHLISPDKLPMDGTNLIGVDFGYENPFAAVFVRIDHDNNWYVYDLIYEKHLTTEDAIQRLRNKMTGQRFSSIIGDQAAAQEIANFKIKNFPIQACVKGRDSIQAGIRLLAEKLKPQMQMDGQLRPKLYVLDIPELLPLVLEFEMYRYHDPDAATKTKEIPIKEHDHALDALRYLVLSNAEHRRPFEKRQRSFDKITGRALS